MKNFISWKIKVCLKQTLPGADVQIYPFWKNKEQNKIHQQLKEGHNLLVLIVSVAMYWILYTLHWIVYIIDFISPNWFPLKIGLTVKNKHFDFRKEYPAYFVAPNPGPQTYVDLTEICWDGFCRSLPNSLEMSIGLSNWELKRWEGEKKKNRLYR